MADRTYTVFIPILQLKREASHVSLQSRQTGATYFHVEDAYKGLYLYRSWDENIITIACLDAVTLVELWLHVTPPVCSSLRARQTT